jgi:hypothetical protein
MKRGTDFPKHSILCDKRPLSQLNNVRASLWK